MVISTKISSEKIEIPENEGLCFTLKCSSFSTKTSHLSPIWQNKLQTQIKAQIQPLPQAGTDPDPQIKCGFVSGYGCGCGFVYFGILRKSQQSNTRTSERVTLGQPLEANEEFVRVSSHDDEANLSLLIWSVLATNINFVREKDQELKSKKTDFLVTTIQNNPKIWQLSHDVCPPPLNALWYWTVAGNFCTADNSSWL